MANQRRQGSSQGTISRGRRRSAALHGAQGAQPAGPRAEGAARLASRNAAADKACNILGCASVELLDLPDNRMDRLELLDVVKRIETFIHRYQPETLFTHHAGDVNIDHRIVHDAVIAACRPQPGHPVRELLFFEVPSSTEWRPPGSGEIFSPNVFSDISTTLEKKLEALRAYDLELRTFPHPRSIQAVNALVQWRSACVGVEAAEAFVWAAG